MAKTYYYAIVNRNGNLVTLDGQLPIYWNKGVAVRERIQRCGDSDRIRKLRIHDIKKLVNNGR
jgi:hypothetical protein